MSESEEEDANVEFENDEQYARVNRHYDIDDRGHRRPIVMCQKYVYCGEKDLDRINYYKYGTRSECLRTGFGIAQAIAKKSGNIYSLDKIPYWKYPEKYRILVNNGMRPFAANWNSRKKYKTVIDFLIDNIGDATLKRQYIGLHGNLNKVIMANNRLISFLRTETGRNVGRCLRYNE